jgi:serine/threonine-protein kinase
VLVTVFRISEITVFIVSLIIFAYRSDNWVALWLSFAIGLLGVGSGAYIVLSVVPAGDWLLVGYSFTLIEAAISLLFLLPDGRLFPKAARWAFIPYVLWELFRHYQQGVQSELYFAAPIIVWYLPLILVFCAGVIAQVIRYRHASPVARHQVKWLVLGIAIYFVSYVMFFVRVVLSDVVAAAGSGAAFVIFQVGMSAINPLGAMILAICIGLSVTRYRLYDVNVVINRSLVYGLVTVLMAAIFLGGGFLLQRLFGQEQSGIAFAVSILAAGMLFNPARQRVQRFIDRRFYGFRFDLNQVKRAQKLPEVKNPGALTGKTMGKYQVFGVIGKGGMGEVYQGFVENRSVALKILPVEMAQKEDMLKRFEREAEVLAKIHHPNIVKLYDAGISEGVYYIAMEFIEGRELSSIIRQRGALPLEEAQQVMQDCAQALDYAHNQGFVHRDIKSSNILIRLKADRETEEAVLMDFGIAKIREAHTSITATGTIGTIDYMAPEQIVAAKAVDHRADIYALGIVLYEMLIGERPFRGTAAQVLFAHLQQPAPDPRAVNPHIPAHIARALSKALDKTPSERFQTAGEFAAALRNP